MALAESASRHVIAAAQLLAVDDSCTANVVRDTNSAIEPNAVTIRIVQQSQSNERLELTEYGWMLFPTRTPLSVFGMSTEESTEIEELFEDVKQPLISVSESTSCVRLLGPVGVQTKEGNDIQFEKSKALELLAWISTHRERPTRVAARTALWEMNVQDATFNNIVSDLRRGLSRSAKDNSEILLRTFSDDLSLLDTVITDADILEQAVHQAHEEMNEEAADSLRQALIYVRDLPFAGTRYLWPDTEGITSRLVLTAITAAILLAEHCLERADIEGVFWATGQGLKVLRGHEELIALRMRAFAARGDFAGIESEWSSYERTVRRDRHFGGSVSPILREVHQGLIA
jgi:two-component SAPR family response regulator